MENLKSEITAGTHISYWTDSIASIAFAPLKKDIKTDVVIVGAGIAGLSIAYCLSKQKINVTIIEDGYVGSGETGRTTAHLVTALDDRYYHLEKLFSEEEAKLAAQSHASAIDFVEKTIKEENIDCDFKRLSGYLFLHPSDKPESLKKEMEASQRAGLNVEMLDQVPGMNGEKQSCIEFKNQAQFHPLKYLKGLCDAIIKNGGHIYTETHASEINEKGIVSKSGFTVSADHVVIATNSPVNNKYVMHLQQYPYRTYAIAARIKKGIIPEALWWDTGDFYTKASIPPYHYIRTQKYNDIYDLVICGGEDHATGMASADVIPEENRYAMLEEWCKRHFNIEEVVYRWSGQVMEPMDSLAYIGRNPFDKKNVYIVTGDSGNGMTHSVIAGILITDLITGKKNDWEKLYSPSRFKIFKAGKVFFKEFVGGFITYLQETPGNFKKEVNTEIREGEGKLIELGNKKYGAYMDENKQLHLVEAECTHLGCIVKWNNDEKSWDCPCHGSRFTTEGKVINGPANTDLPYHKEEF